jgi:hypothetical protein
MYLAIMLILVTILVFYNEINNKMDLSEYILLGITFIAIIKSAINYIKINKVQEGFVSNNNNNNNNKINKNQKEIYNGKNNLELDEYDLDDENAIIVKSEDSEEYLDSDELPYDIKKNKNKNKNKNSFDSLNLNFVKTQNAKDTKAIKHVNEVLYDNILHFADIPAPTDYDSQVKSVFNPKIIIGKGKNNDYNTNNDKDRNDNDGTGFGSYRPSSAWNSAFKNDGFKFNNSMYPSTNLWRDDHSFYNNGNSECAQTDENVKSSIGINANDWTKSMDDYNKGRWRKNLYTKASDYIDYTSSSMYKPSPTNPKPTNTSLSRFEDVGSATSTATNDSKKCAEYDSIYEDQAGDLIVKDYTQSKKWVAGYTYVPPVYWDVPQKHTSICRPNGPNVHKLTGLMDRGLPLNALELNNDGEIANTEDTVNLTNVGSMIPKFNFQEQPFSKPYV